MDRRIEPFVRVYRNIAFVESNLHTFQYQLIDYWVFVRVGAEYSLQNAEGYGFCHGKQAGLLVHRDIPQLGDHVLFCDAIAAMAVSNPHLILATVITANL